jgi:hypothetical protein
VSENRNQRVTEPRREGKLFRVRDGDILPERCAVCNAPTQCKPVKITFAADRGSGLVGALIVTAWDAATGNAYKGAVRAWFHFCPKHRRRGVLLWTGIVLLMAIGIGGTWAAIKFGGNNTPLPLFTMIPMIFTPFAAVQLLFNRTNPWFRAKRFDGLYVWLKGARPAFLDSLKGTP